MIYDFVVAKPALKTTKNLDLEALFSQTTILDLKATLQDDQLLYRMKVSDTTDQTHRVEKLMDYLKYRGCHVSVISRYAAELPPQNQGDKDLDQQKYESMLSEMQVCEHK